MQEKTMRTRRTILNLLGAGAAGTLAVALIASPAAAQTATGQGVIAAPAPTSATPEMIDEAVQRSQARTAKAAPTATSAGKPEQFGSEEPFTYVPGKTF
jgi:hypothetical protein